jgi:hypothetical protein
LKLVESGEKEKLMERLVECGWRDEMKALCRFAFSCFLNSETIMNVHGRYKLMSQNQSYILQLLK